MANASAHSVSNTIPDYFAETKAIIDTVSTQEVQGLILELTDAYMQARQVFIVGNGGSAATASHLACDLAKTVLGRPVDGAARRFNVTSLTDNLSLITAWANDVSFDRIYAEQLTNAGRSGDLVIAITGSGNSPNIVEAVKVAKQRGMRTLGLLGFDGGIVKHLVDRCVLVNSDHYGHIEDVHMMLVHLVTAHFQALVAHGARM